MSTEAIAGTLESDLRLLSSEARRADGLASQLTGWLSGPEHPQIKEAAERAILRLRSFGARDDGLEHLRNSKVLEAGSGHKNLRLQGFLTSQPLNAGRSPTVCYGNRVQELKAYMLVLGECAETGSSRCNWPRRAACCHPGY